MRFASRELLLSVFRVVKLSTVGDYSPFIENALSLIIVLRSFTNLFATCKNTTPPVQFRPSTQILPKRVGSLSYTTPSFIMDQSYEERALYKNTQILRNQLQQSPEIFFRESSSAALEAVYVASTCMWQDQSDLSIRIHANICEVNRIYVTMYLCIHGLYNTETIYG